MADAARLAAKIRRLGYVILCAGLIVSFAVYFITGQTPDNQTGVIGYENSGGSSYAILADGSKRYQYDMERIGGKSMLFAAQLYDWFASLWQAENLPYTLAALSIAAALACLLLAHLIALPMLDEEDDSSWRG